MAAACVRRGYLEKLHDGFTPVTRTGDYSDVKVIDAEGREIPWNQVSRIDQDEMKTLITRRGESHPHIPCTDAVLCNRRQSIPSSIGQGRRTLDKGMG